MADQPLTDKDLLKVARQITPDNLFRIAVEYLDLGKSEVEFIRANAKQRDRTVQEIHLDCLMEWKNKRGVNGTRTALHDCFQKASEEALIDRSSLGFLVEKVVLHVFSRTVTKLSLLHVRKVAIQTKLFLPLHIYMNRRITTNA